jgi:hypothetical protein
MALTARRSAREPLVEKRLRRLNCDAHGGGFVQKGAVKHDALIMVDYLPKRNREIRTSELS